MADDTNWYPEEIERGARDARLNSFNRFYFIWPHRQWKNGTCLFYCFYMGYSHLKIYWHSIWALLGDIIVAIVDFLWVGWGGWPAVKDVVNRLAELPYWWNGDLKASFTLTCTGSPKMPAQPGIVSSTAARLFLLCLEDVTLSAAWMLIF